MLASVIVIGCVETTIDDLPNPKTLSANDKKDYTIVDIRDLMKYPDSYLNKNIYLSGEVSWILEKNGASNLIIDVPIRGSAYETENVLVYYKGSLPRIYKGTNVEVYGIMNGEGTVTSSNPFTNIESEKKAPKIYAVQIIEK